MKLMHTSDKECYGREVQVYSAINECDYCNEEKEILSVDTSDGEYCTFDCCLSCFGEMIRKAQEK